MKAHLTLAARRHIRLLTSAIAPDAARIERRFRSVLRRHRWNPGDTTAILAITPIAASRAQTLAQFLESVAHHGGRLAKMNAALGEVNAMVTACGEIVEEVLAGRHAPAREQLHLIIAQTLQDAYYQVREAEAQVFYGLYHAESESAGLDDLLARMVRIVTRAFHAKSGRIVLEGGEPANAESHVWSCPVGAMGLMEIEFEAPCSCLPREAAMMRAVAERAAKAIERVRLQAEARRAEEEERRRIGRELHDDTAQSLLLLRLQLEMMERDAPPEWRERLQQSREISERAIQDLRRTIAALSPVLLERLGLESALRQLAARFGKSHQTTVEVKIHAGCKGLPMNAQEVVYRVAQESLQNVHKHSRATKVNLCLQSADKRIRLSVRDNGMGFDAEAVSQPLSFGLAGMRERAALLGGSLAVRSVPGKGSSVTLELPRTPVSTREI